MRPGVIADFKAQLVDLGDFFPGQEVLMVVHPAMTHKKCGVEPEVFQKWGYKDRAIRSVIKGQNHKFVRDSDGGHRRSEVRSAAGHARGKSPCECAAPGDAIQKFPSAQTLCCTALSPEVIFILRPHRLLYADKIITTVPPTAATPTSDFKFQKLRENVSRERKSLRAAKKFADSSTRFFPDEGLGKSGFAKTSDRRGQDAS